VALAQNGIELSLANLGAQVPHPDLVSFITSLSPYNLQGEASAGVFVSAPAAEPMAQSAPAAAAHPEGWDISAAEKVS
jgi:hypothetical protein